MRVLLLCTLLCLSHGFQANHEWFSAWMAGGGVDTTIDGNKDNFATTRTKIIRRLIQFGQQVFPSPLKEEFTQRVGPLPTPSGSGWFGKLMQRVWGNYGSTPGQKRSEASAEYPYLGFLPRYQGSAIVAGSPVEWESRCWKKTKATLNKVSDGYELSVEVSGSKEFPCSDYYAFTTVAHFTIGFFPTPIGGTKKYHFKTDGLSASELWDAETKGVRMFIFRGTIDDLLADLADTLVMFSPEATRNVTAEATAVNLKFLQGYRGIDMKKRPIDFVPINESSISSGDFFGIIRLDGLDPMLAWAMGSTTGHTAVALWDEGILYVAESTTNGSYWPTNGIQRTPWSKWITQANKAGYNLVHAPLTAEARKKFDVKAANQFFKENEALQYGFATLLVGWIDTSKNNYPCLPPYPITNESYCLSWPLIETLFPYLNKLVGDNIIGQIFLEAWNHRLGTTGLNPSDCLMEAHKKGIVAENLFKIVEQDSWKYQQEYNNGTSTMGKSMVCNVFVCNVWKAGGLLGSAGKEIQCGETTNWDVYVLDVLGKPPRPPQCVKADPNNPLCQLVGEHTIVLNNYESKSPYPHMAESCPGQAPDYKRDPHC